MLSDYWLLNASNLANYIQLQEGVHWQQSAEQCHQTLSTSICGPFPERCCTHHANPYMLSIHVTDLPRVQYLLDKLYNTVKLDCSGEFPCRLYFTFPLCYLSNA